MADRVGAIPRAPKLLAGALLGALLVALAFLVPAAGARTDASTSGGPVKTIHFAGRTVKAPASWPVFRLAEHPTMCVRLDRRAVYLGSPGASQRCPASAMGRRRAILVGPAARGSGARARTSATGGVTRVASAGSFTGLGFDACAAPSSRAMNAWGSSPYRAIGVYIGGLNRGCSQPNLTASWVAAQVAAGWHLIPTYVGLQAPTSSCGSCAKLSASAATTQGTEAAADAVADARAVGIGPGSPIYFDMESYSRTGSATNATMSFLAAWTKGLHAAGYTSGVYSSAASGIADLAARYGTSYTSPDDIWVANWNGARDTEDPYVPDSAWSDHQRIHQYRGGHDETYGGVTINIDNNYVDGATVGDVSSEEAPRGRLEVASSPAPGQVRVAGWAFDKATPTTPIAIRAYVGGKAGQPQAQPYELGPAAQPRADLAAAHPALGGDHGFDVSFPVAKSRRQRVCVYAANPISGADKYLGCRTVGIAVPIAISHLKSTRRGLRLRITCEWPEGTLCPGQIVLRGHTRVSVVRKRHGHRVVVSRVVKSAFARRGFTLTGGKSHGFLVGLSRRGRQLIGNRSTQRVQLVVALPGSRLTHPLTLRLR
ncbi:MAG TPA: DUF1906 domain-containing protein [Solirubrobacterales bacterium]|nr:DUF1906 domain-containing protein [Solirubrobacterales bacterium]